MRHPNALADAMPFDLVGEAVNRGDADLAAHRDPWAHSIEKRVDFTKIADTQTGVYEGHTCCVLGSAGWSRDCASGGR